MATALQSAKALVSAFHAAIDSAAAGNETSQVCANHLHAEHTYRGVHPFNDIAGPAKLSETVWTPLKEAMPVLQRRPDIFFAGHHHMKADGALWVVCMGHFLGDWTEAWLGMKPPMKTTFLPYVAWYRIEQGAIVETVEWIDLLSVITQTGRNPYAQHQTAAHLMSPGPLTHDGLLKTSQDTSISHKTFDLTYAMLTELAETMTSPADHMTTHWHNDMNWFGPAGIGACLGFSGYRRGHTGPFEVQQDFVDYYEESAATAEGHYAAFLWRPCLGMRNTGGYMGVPANDIVSEMRVVDVYRRDGDKLAENWIFIDMLHFIKMQGIDLLQEIGE
ncbi:MAG: ester cyclase [Granulosicoccus sp.]|nr:ester cyclase [Granulosicoccus sp.]